MKHDESQQLRNRNGKIGERTRQYTQTQTAAGKQR